MPSDWIAYVSLHQVTTALGDQQEDKEGQQRWEGGGGTPPLFHHSLLAFPTLPTSFQACPHFTSEPAFPLTLGEMTKRRGKLAPGGSTDSSSRSNETFLLASAKGQRRHNCFGWGSLCNPILGQTRLSHSQIPSPTPFFHKHRG